MSLLLAACTSKWEPIGSPELTYQEADSKCEFDSFKLFPVRNEVAQKTVYKKITKKCKKSDECGDDKTYEEDAPATESYVMDVNENSRNKEYRLCMKRQGWQQKNYYVWEQ